jgi:hypothetical protein
MKLLLLLLQIGVDALSNIGYSLQSSVCDIVDNSISHGLADNIYICFEYIENQDKFVFMIYDDGKSMNELKLIDAMKLGSSDKNYKHNDLGKFGMGLKTASLAHCNILSVIAKEFNAKYPSCIILDKNLIKLRDEWLYKLLNNKEINDSFDEEKRILKKCFNNVDFFSEKKSYTFMIWQDLFSLKRKSDKYFSDAKRNNHIQKEQTNVESHLRMVFHRFINGENEARKVNIFYNGKRLNGWDPCLTNLNKTLLYKDKSHRDNKDYIGYVFNNGESEVKIKRYVLPKKDQIDPSNDLIITERSHTDRIMKIDKWQGLYFYRNNRLIDYGGWYDGTGTEPHITYARASVDLNSEHDKYFTLNINKSKILIDHSFKVFLKENMPKFRAKAKTLYGGRKRKVNNTLRKNSKKLIEIIAGQARKNDIKVIGPNSNGEENKKNYVEIKNISGGYKDRDINFLKQDSELLKKRIIGEEFSDSELLWKVIPDPHNLMLVKINKLHNLYKLYYEEEDSKYDKITAIIDSVLISLAYTEICYKTEKTEQLFEDINRNTGKFLNTLIDNKIIS